jgi:hypothetical protein
MTTCLFVDLCVQGNAMGAALFVALPYFLLFEPHMGLSIAAMQTSPGDGKHLHAAKLIAGIDACSSLAPPLLCVAHP